VVISVNLPSSHDQLNLAVISIDQNDHQVELGGGQRG
jgi:hypothetical protein